MPGQLKKAPLVEALLEIKWELTKIGPDTFQDPAYGLLIGLLYDRIHDKFKFIEPLPITQIPDEMTPYMVKHRYRVEKNRWPLVQLGPGVLSLNFTSPYNWEMFMETAQFVLPQLVEAYTVARPEDEGTKLRVTSVMLRYINAVDLNWTESNALEFLASKLHTVFQLPPQISEAETISGVPTSLNLQIGYPLQQPKGQGIVRFASGRKGQDLGLIWELMVHSQNEDAPQLTALETFWAWLCKAHDDVIEKWFFALIEGDLEQQFRGG
ncbi:MAG: TIGR04255 family protein [Chloroflexi bacterium]|nr:TIGR04255 family protein [Chloroflexota bacterium]